MNNVILELKTVVETSRQNGASFDSIRVRLKEVLHYFVLDCIYNSEFKDIIFYGGTCLRIVYGLPRLSEDLDFEWQRSDFEKLAIALDEHFKKNIQLQLTTKTQVNREKTICRITLSFPVMYELGLSPSKDETLRIKVEVRLVSKEYMSRLQPIFTPKTGYGRSFIIRHYDFPTLFAGKLSAILSRPQKGFTVGNPQEGVNFKGRDFYDLIWYMKKGVLPNREMLAVNGRTEPVEDVFDEISVFIAKHDMKSGLQKDLSPLFDSQNYVTDFVDQFDDRFSRLKKEFYTLRQVKKLKRIFMQEDFSNDNHAFIFEYVVAEHPMLVKFIFTLTWEFLRYGGEISVNALGVNEDIFSIQEGPGLIKKERLKQYIGLFKGKIDEYLKRNNNEVYFERWRSKLVCTTTKTDFNPEKEIRFVRGEDLLNKKVTLEVLAQ